MTSWWGAGGRAGAATVAVLVVAGCAAASSGGGTVVSAASTGAAARQSSAAPSALPSVTTPAPGPATTAAETPPSTTTPPTSASTTAPTTAPAVTAPATTAPTSATSAAPALPPPVARPPAPDPGPSLAHWAGTWQRHGEEISLDANGHGTMVFRAGVWCSQDPAPPCDSIVDDEIVDGGYATFHLSYVDPDQAEAGGYMDSTTEPVPLRPVTVADAYGSDPSDPYRAGSITVSGLDADPQVYCAPDYTAPDNGCGA